MATIDELRLRELLRRSVHDLRNPLAVVRASVEWLEVELEDRADALDAVRDASTAVARLLVIVDDLDLIAHLDAGRVVKRDAVDMGSVIGRVTASAGARFASYGIAVTSTVNVATDITGDAPMLVRAIDALVEACARGSGAGTCVEVDARFAGEADLEIQIGLRGTVPNEGPAASIEALASNGVGVQVALRIVEAHGGSLEVYPTTTMPRIVVRIPR